MIRPPDDANGPTRATAVLSPPPSRRRPRGAKPSPPPGSGCFRRPRRPSVRAREGTFSGRPVKAKEKRFWLAAAEMGISSSPVRAGPLREDEATHISTESVRKNLDAGFSFDNDKFATNQLGHSIAGASSSTPAHERLLVLGVRSVGPRRSWAWRSSGDAGAVAQRLVNTTLGGLTLGEASYRLSQMLLDDRARGGARVAREALAGLVNPTQFLTRLLRGDAFAVREERGDVLEPSRFVAELDAGWRHYVSSRRADPDQALFSASVRYGDPFDRAVSRPFDSFDLDVDLSYRARPGSRTSRSAASSAAGISIRRAAAGTSSALSWTSTTRTTTADPQLAVVPVRLLSMAPRGGVEPRAEALGAVAPLVAIQNDHPEASSGLVGRAYDYGPGAAVFTAVRCAAASSISRRSRTRSSDAHVGRHRAERELQSFRRGGPRSRGGSVRVGGPGPGASASRRTTTPTFRTDATQWRAFVSWLFR